MIKPRRPAADGPQAQTFNVLLAYDRPGHDQAEHDQIFALGGTSVWTERSDRPGFRYRVDVRFAVRADTVVGATEWAVQMLSCAVRLDMPSLEIFTRVVTDRELVEAEAFVAELERRREEL